MPLIGVRRTAVVTSRRAARGGRRRLRLALPISFLVHAAVLVLLLVTVKHERRPEMLPPPSPVTMVFESGRRNGPTVPEPSEQAAPSVPTPPVLAPTPTPEPPTPEPPTPEAPGGQPLPPPEPVEPPPPVTPPEPVPLPPAPAPPPVEQTPEAQPPPPPLAPPKRVPPKPVPPTPKPPPPPKRPPPPKPSDFPAPMDFSLGKPLNQPQTKTKQASRPHPPGTIDMSLGPAMKGTANETPYGEDEEGGPDWRNALSLWVSEHAYYPEQARLEGEEGDAKVHVVARHDGRVTSVETIGKSGSIWLALALLALFRDAHIPPLPTEGNEPIEFNFTMHYVLRRIQ
jgi:protein TonB